MKSLFTLILLAFSCSIVVAQVANFSMSPDSAIVNGKASFDDILQQDIHITNSSASNRTFVWERTTVSTPFGWTSTVCDPIACRPSSTSTAEFELKANESYTMLLDVSTDGAPGTGYYLLKLYEKGQPNQYFIGKYRFNANLVGSKDAAESVSMRVFPNPASDYFTVQSSVVWSEVQLCSAEGKLLRSYAYAADGRYPLEDVQKGLYLVQLVSENKAKLATKKLVIN